MRAILPLLIALGSAACSAQVPTRDAVQPARAESPAPSAEPAVRADINAAYLDPSLDVEGLDQGFSAESREVFAARDAVTSALGIALGDDVADIGAGTGIYLEPFSRAVGEAGTVYAVDIAPSLIAYVEDKAARLGLANIEPVLGGEASTTLPGGSVDLAFTSDVYHHFEAPRAMNRHLFAAIRPGGTYAVLDFRRGPDAPGWIKRHVRSDMATVIEEVTAAGFAYEGEVQVPGLRENYLILFTRPGA